MGKTLTQWIKKCFRREASAFTFEPVEHRMAPDPVLPKSMMEAMAPAYEEELAEQEEKKDPSP